MIFKSESCFSGVLEFPGLSVVGELCSDDAKVYWFLLLMALCLLLAIHLSLVLAVLGMPVLILPLCPWIAGRLVSLTVADIM